MFHKLGFVGHEEILQQEKEKLFTLKQMDRETDDLASEKLAVSKRVQQENQPDPGAKKCECFINSSLQMQAEEQARRDAEVHPASFFVSQINAQIIHQIETAH